MYQNKTPRGFNWSVEPPAPARVESGTLGGESEEQVMARRRLLVLLAVPAVLFFALARWDDPARPDAPEEPQPDTGERAEVALGPPTRPAVTAEPVDRIGDTRFLMSSGATALVFRPDGRRLAATGYDSPVVVEWDTATGNETRRYSDGEGGAHVVGYTPDGARLVAHNGRGQTVVFDTSTGAVLVRVPVPLTVAPDGKVGVGFADKEQLTVWNLETGKAVRVIGTISPSNRTECCFSPDGAQVAVCNWSGTVYVAPVAGTAPVRVIAVPGHDNGIINVVWPRADRLIAIWYSGFASHDPATGKQLDRKSSKYAYWLRGVTAVGGGRVFAKVVNMPGLVELDPKDLSRVPNRTIPFNHWSDLLALSADGTTVATSYGGKLRLIDAATGRALHPDVNLYPVTSVSEIQFSRDGKRLLTAGDHSIRVWDVATGKPTTIIDRDDGHINYARLSPDGRYVAGIDGAAHYPLVIWDATTGAEVFRQPTPDGDDHQTIPGFDSRGVLWVCNGRDFTLHEVPSGRVLQTVPGFKQPICNTISPDGSRLVSAGWTAFAVRDTDPAAEWRVVARYPGRHIGGCKWDEAPCPSPVAFSPNGHELLTGRGWMFWNGKPRNLRAWDTRDKPTTGANRVLGYGPTYTPDGRFVVSRVPVAKGAPRELLVSDAATGAELFRFDTLGDVGGLAFTPDGTRLVVARSDTTLTVWNWANIERDSAPRK